MQENKKNLDYDDISKFIDSIDVYSDEEIIEKIDYILNYFQKAHLYNLEKSFKILSIKTIKDLNEKTRLIKKFFYNDSIHRIICYDWESILASINNLDENNMIIVLKQLFPNYRYEESSQTPNIPNNLKFGIELEYHNASFQQIRKMFDTKEIETIMKSLSIPTHIITKITNNSDFEKENEFSKWIFSKETDDNLPEAASPIMTNTLDNTNQIKAICELFKALGAQVYGGTGLHINVGADYFKGNINALKYLLIIWSEWIRCSA